MLYLAGTFNVKLQMASEIALQYFFHLGSVRVPEVQYFLQKVQEPIYVSVWKKKQLS